MKPHETPSYWRLDAACFLSDRFIARMRSASLRSLVAASGGIEVASIRNVRQCVFTKKPQHGPVNQGTGLKRVVAALALHQFTGGLQQFARIAQMSRSWLGTALHPSLRKIGLSRKFSKKLSSSRTMGMRLRSVTEAAHARTHAWLQFRRDDACKRAAKSGSDRSAPRGIRSGMDR